MTKHWRLAAIPLCLGLLCGEVRAGISGFGSFNSFQYSQVGPIVPLGLGEGSAITLALSTQFEVTGSFGMPFSLVVTMTEGPGVLNVPVIVNADLMNSPLCDTIGDAANCLFQGEMTFEPGTDITPGTLFGIKGELIHNTITIATAQDSFTASVSEPASLALMGLSVMAVGAFTRRRSA